MTQYVIYTTLKFDTMKEKTFEELIIEKFSENGMIKMSFSRNEMIDMMQQVREATITEIENKANEYGEYGTADYAHELPTDRIKLAEKNE